MLARPWLNWQFKAAGGSSEKNLISARPPWQLASQLVGRAYWLRWFAEVRPGVRALLKRAKQTGVQGSLAKAAARFLRRQVELEDASPLHDAPAARAEHAARMSEAQVALREGRAAGLRPAVLVAAGDRRCQGGGRYSPRE